MSGASAWRFLIIYKIVEADTPYNTKETGFLADFVTATNNFRKKPGFWPPVCNTKETGFLADFVTAANNFRKKPGFWPPVCKSYLSKLEKIPKIFPASLM